MAGLGHFYYPRAPTRVLSRCSEINVTFGCSGILDVTHLFPYSSFRATREARRANL